MKVLKKQQGTPVNLRIEGEKELLKGVLLRATDTTGVFAVLTGKRGRPRLVHQDNIVSVTVPKFSRKVVVRRNKVAA